MASNGDFGDSINVAALKTQLERDFSNKKAEMEREVGLLKSEVASKTREIEVLKQQNEENLKN